MYCHKCWNCEGTGSTCFYQNRGRCYNCHGNGTMTPEDVNRENQRRGKCVRIITKKRDVFWTANSLVLRDAGDHLEWCTIQDAILYRIEVLIPTADLWNWEKTFILGMEGLSCLKLRTAQKIFG